MPLPNRPVNQRLGSNTFFGALFNEESRKRRKILEARNRREMGSPKKPSPNKPSPKKNSPPKKQRRPTLSNNEFRLAFEGPEATARRAKLYARNAAEYANRLPSLRANAGSAANAAKFKRLSAANNAALRAFFKKAANKARR